MALCDEQIAERLRSYTPPAQRGREEVAIPKYAKLVGSAAEGAIRAEGGSSRRMPPAGRADSHCGAPGSNQGRM